MALDLCWLDRKMSDRRIFAPLRQFQYLIWLYRRDLRTRFDLNSKSGYHGFLLWWLIFGRREYPKLNGEPSEGEMTLLMSPALEIEQDVALPLTRGLLAVWESRSDLREQYPLERREGRQGIIGWWLRGGYKDYDLPLL